MFSSYRFGVRRFWERFTPVSRSTISVSSSLFTTCSISHVNENGNTMPNYSLGSVIKLTANFKNASVNVDPAAVILRIKNPLGVQVSYTYGVDLELVKESVGNYSLNFIPTQEGRHVFQFSSTGTYASAAESSLDIDESCFN